MEVNRRASLREHVGLSFPTRKVNFGSWPSQANGGVVLGPFEQCSFTGGCPDISNCLTAPVKNLHINNSISCFKPYPLGGFVTFPLNLPPCLWFCLELWLESVDWSDSVNDLGYDPGHQVATF